MLLEKPLEVATARAEALVAACACRRRHPRRRAAAPLPPRRRAPRRLLAEGALGRIAGCSTTIRLWRPQSYYDEPGRGTLARDGGGVLMTQGIHTLDLMLVARRPGRRGDRLRRHHAVHRMETEDIACAAVRFASGALGVIDATTAAYPGFPERIELACTRATASLAGAGLTVALARRPPARPRAGPERRRHRRRPDGLLARGPPRGPRRLPAARCATARPPRVSGAEALKVHRLIDALIETGRTGQPIALHCHRFGNGQSRAGRLFQTGNDAI